MKLNRENSVRGFVREVTERILDRGDCDTLEDIAKLAKVSYQTILKWRSGARMPEIRKLNRLLHHLEPGLTVGHCLLLPQEISAYRDHEVRVVIQNQPVKDSKKKGTHRAGMGP